MTMTVSVRTPISGKPMAWILPGATNATYTLTQAEVGKVITVVVVHTDALGTVENPISSAATTAVVNVNDETTGDVTITGTPREDEVLTANTNAIDDEDGIGTYTYQWQADGVDIAGATNTTYTLTQAEVGKVITVVVVHTDALGTVENPISSAATTAVVNVNDEGSIGAIIGTASEGEELTAGAITDPDGTTGGSSVAATYQWKADGANIPGATQNTYTLTSVEIGKVITVEASYTDAYGTQENLTSDPTNPVTNVNETGSIAPIIGDPTQGQNLRAGTITDGDGTTGGSSVAATYQWRADGVDIAGATNDNYTLTQAEVGKTITVEASYTDTQGTQETLISDPTTPVADIDDLGSIADISGDTTQGQTLTAGTISDPDGGVTAVSYQWKADGVDIAGATNATYTLTQAEVGKAITVEVTYTDAQGSGKTTTSAATAAVANVNDETTGDVTITGTPREDEVLTANTSALADNDGIGTYTYQWQADGVDIAGATNATYTLTQAEVGKSLP